MNPQPPRAAVWLSRLFGSDSLAGDLAEEFADLVPQRGLPAARRWYWRQTILSFPYLMGRRSLGKVTVLVLAAFLARWMFSMWSTPWVHRTLDAALPLDDHYVFRLSLAMFTTRLLVNAMFGALLALAAKDREMPATILLATLGFLLALPGGIPIAIAHTAIFSAAIIIAGAAVRTYRITRIASK